MFSVVLTAALAVTAATKRGTDAQCAAWYPRDLLKQARCGSLQLSRQEHARMDRQLKVCKDFLSALKRNGYRLEVAKFKDGDRSIECGEN